MSDQRAYNIYVNSRLYEINGTGIPTYIKSLYNEILATDTVNKYTFLQTARIKIMGDTLIAGKNSFFGSVFFDLVLALKLASSQKGNFIFHATSNILPIIKPKRARYIVTIHDLAFLQYPQYQSKIFNTYYRFAVGRSLKLADIVIADSENTKDDIKKFYKTPSEKIKVIYPGVKEINAKREKQPDIIDGKYFLSICTHPKRKNILSVIEAVANNKDLSGFKYVIAGHMSEDHKAELADKITSLNLDGRVIVIGFVSDLELMNLYEGAEFFIYPSFYEGFGFPVLEAMSLGCPVITANNSSLTEVTPDDEWLVDAFSVNDISNAMSRIVRLTAGDRKILIDKNFHHVKKFQWTLASSRMIEEFNSLKV